MAKHLDWENQADGSYVWVLGLHYYTERDDDGKWPVACMVGDSDIWEGGRYPTRYQAQAAAQAHFNEQIDLNK